MRKEKKIFLGILLLIFLVITIIIFYLSSQINVEEPPQSGSNPALEKRFELVDDYDEFFSIQTALNDTDNIRMDESYFVNEVYVNGNSVVLYYFIKATNFYNGNTFKDIYYLLIVEKNSNYSQLSAITEPISDLEDYAKNYDIKMINITQGNRLVKRKFSGELVLTIYIEYFKKLLLMDTYSAYNMLENSTKSKYIDYNDFKNQIIDIYDMLSSKVFAYSLEERDANKIYKLEDDNRNKITIYEDSIMNFKISY